MNKSKEILHHQKKQKILKNEIQDIKNKLPKYILGFVLFTCINLYFLEDSFYKFFGNSVRLIISIVVVSSSIFLLYLIKMYFNIQAKQKESKALGSKLYKLMKLEVNDDDDDDD